MAKESYHGKAHKYATIPNRAKDLPGKSFGHLTAVGWSGQYARDRALVWICKCRCGSLVNVPSNELNKGRRKSCGCVRKKLGLCSIGGCGEDARAKDLCNKHYKRERNGMHFTKDAVERFWLKTSLMQNGCIEWIGHRDACGYGQTTFEGKRENTHRLAYKLFIGGIPDGLFVCHSCDNPSCVNKDHLFLGTQKDNIRDAIIKGRMSWQKT